MHPLLLPFSLVISQCPTWAAAGRPPCFCLRWASHPLIRTACCPTNEPVHPQKTYYTPRRVFYCLPDALY